MDVELLYKDIKIKYITPKNNSASSLVSLSLPINLFFFSSPSILMRYREVAVCVS